jgi:hypothetical protein
MLFDSLLQLSDPQSITADAISEHVIDLGPLGSDNLGAGASANTIRDWAAGRPLYLHILVTTTMDSAGEAATLTVTLESDSVVGLDDSATVHWTTSAIAEATLVAGYWIAKGVPIPPGAYERYVGLRYNAGTEDFTSGAVKAWISDSRYDDRTYESGFSTQVN